MEKSKIVGISEICFDMVIDNIAMEGEEEKLFACDKVHVSDVSLMDNLSRETVCAFLECDDTRVYAVEDEDGNYDLVAHNHISNETVKVSGIGNHFVAFIDVMKYVIEKRKELAQNASAKVLTHEFVKKVNEEILFHRYGEIGIGEYRTVDFFGRPVEVCIAEVVDGRKKPLRCVQFETSVGNNVPNKMDELLDWVNMRFADNEDVIATVAEFHSRFFKIHPFRDGNGRTCRLLTNFLLLVGGRPMINVPVEQKDLYSKCINYANAISEEDFRMENEDYDLFADEMERLQGKRNEVNKYKPLARFLKTCIVKGNSRAVINRIINYRKEGPKDESFYASQIE